MNEMENFIEQPSVFTTSRGKRQKVVSAYAMHRHLQPFGTYPLLSLLIIHMKCLVFRAFTVPYRNGNIQLVQVSFSTGLMKRALIYLKLRE